MNWERKFDDPIVLPDGRKLNTLKQVGEYIIGLPKADHAKPEWQVAMQALILVAENDGPTMFARIGFMRGLIPHVERVFDTSRNGHHWNKRQLARER